MLERESHRRRLGKTGVHQRGDEERLHALLWYERVPSHSNPADKPSRGDAPAGGFKHRSEVQKGLPMKFIAEALVQDAEDRG